MRPLHPLTLNLHGQILIEASAGTGKTYTIALLFLRLLLERGLSVDEILVVTFTKAATEELRGRIRQRIRDALDVLEGQGPDDPLLRDLLDNATKGIAEERAGILLGDALTRMDEAAISTIHGFCRRILQEHAFESGAPFAMEFLESEQLQLGRHQPRCMLGLQEFVQGIQSRFQPGQAVALALIARKPLILPQEFSNRFSLCPPLLPYPAKERSQSSCLLGHRLLTDSRDALQ
ncbi:MAG: hypothetical protein D3906_07290, partial [Candidatus Electrothrix sp. AUS1_2]|nr:hypothetical protein [Candidatus Electrothrix sp. AUS1_2]